MYQCCLCQMKGVFYVYSGLQYRHLFHSHFLENMDEIQNVLHELHQRSMGFHIHEQIFAIVSISDKTPSYVGETIITAFILFSQSDL